MKRLLLLLPVLALLWSSCAQTQFIAEDDVYSYPDPMAMRPKSSNIQPEASLDGFVYNQENGSRATFYDPENDLAQNFDTRDARVVNNYYFNDFHDPWGFHHPRMRTRFRSNVYIGFGYNPWGPSWGMRPWGWNSWGYSPWGPSWGMHPWGASWGMGYNPWGMNSWGHPGMGWGMHPWGMNSWGHHGMGWGMNSWGHHGGMGWNSWGNHGHAGGSGFGGNAGGNTVFQGPRPNISSSHNPNNLNVGRGNISPISSDGKPINQTLTADPRPRGTGRDAVPVGNTSRPERSERTDRQTLANNSSPWNPRVDGRTNRPTDSNNRGDANNRNLSRNPGAVIVNRDNAPAAGRDRNSGRANEGATRPSNNAGATRPSSNRPTIAPNNRPSSRPSSAPSSRPSAPSSRPSSTPSSRPSAPSSRPSSTPSSRPSAPSSRPSAPSSRPSAPSSRPSAPSSRPSAPSSRPSAPSSRPSSSPRSSSPSSGGSRGGSRGGRP